MNSTDEAAAARQAAREDLVRDLHEVLLDLEGRQLLHGGIISDVYPVENLEIHIDHPDGYKFVIRWADINGDGT